MIFGKDIFGRDPISPREKKMLKAANKTAESLFNKRYSPGLARNWDIPVEELTLHDVELSVIEAVKSSKSGVRKRA